jgi:hypothetical protein
MNSSDEANLDAKRLVVWLIHARNVELKLQFLGWGRDYDTFLFSKDDHILSPIVSTLYITYKSVP